jgi:isochorismate synthase
MNSYAIFRLPHAEHCALIKGDAEVVPSLADISNQQGFLLAPFMPSDEDPILLIKGDVQELTTPLPSHLSSLTSHLSPLIF